MTKINYMGRLWNVSKSKRGSDFVRLDRSGYRTELKKNRSRGVLTALEVKMSEIGFGKNYKFI